jgi:hypothetical protein
MYKYAHFVEKYGCDIHQVGMYFFSQISKIL